MCLFDELDLAVVQSLFHFWYMQCILFYDGYILFIFLEFVLYFIINFFKIIVNFLKFLFPFF